MFGLRRSRSCATRLLSTHHVLEDKLLHTLALLKQSGFMPQWIIDVGAYHATFSESCSRFYPDSHYLLIEANADHAAQLQTFTNKDPRKRFCEIALLGREGTPQHRFFKMGTGSSIYEEQSSIPRQAINLPMSTLEFVARKHDIRPEVFLKLDVQGAELDVLTGAGPAILDVTEMILMETSVVNYNKDAPTVFEALTFMDRIGYQLYDLVSIMRLPDLSLNQLDLLFCRKRSRFHRTGLLF